MRTAIETGFPEPTLEDLLLFGSLPGVILEHEETRVRTLNDSLQALQ